MRDFFGIKKHNTTYTQETLCGLTTFLTMSYVLFVNPSIVSQTGMPASGLFVATALAAATMSLFMGLFANVPFGIASGMGLNTFFTYSLCFSLGFHWKEALAITFISGIVQIIIMLTSLRKSLVNALPVHLRLAFGVGLGIFIAYIGIKNAGFLAFTTPPGNYILLENATVLSNSSAIPSLISTITAHHLIAIIGLFIAVVLISLEKKTGETYLALPISIITATFVGIPLQVTDIATLDFFDFTALASLNDVFFAFWGDPGILSILASQEKILTASLMILVLSVVSLTGCIGTMLGISNVQNAEIFTDDDLKTFRESYSSTRLDKALLCNATGGCVSALWGTSMATTYMESITGIVAGGKTGFVAVVVGCLFLLCLPFSSLISTIPAAAIAPALIISGAFMLPLARRINWTNFEESFPAFITILCIPIGYDLIYGIAAGIISHVIIQITVGNMKKIHPILYAIVCIFIFIILIENLS